MKDYYKILGLPQGSSAIEIKKAFHKLAHIHHPDKGGDEAKFKEISEAYSALSKNPSYSAMDYGYTPDVTVTYTYTNRGMPPDFSVNFEHLHKAMKQQEERIQQMMREYEEQMQQMSKKRSKMWWGTNGTS